MFLVLILGQGCKENIVLNPMIEGELIAYNKMVKDKAIKKYSTLCLSFYEYDNTDRVAITLSNDYSSKEVQGLFYIEDMPVLLSFEGGSIDRSKLNLIMDNPDYGILKDNLKNYAESNEEKPQDSFDPPFVLFDIEGDELVKVN